VLNDAMRRIAALMSTPRQPEQLILRLLRDAREMLGAEAVRIRLFGEDHALVTVAELGDVPVSPVDADQDGQDDESSVGEWVGESQTPWHEEPVGGEAPQASAEVSLSRVALPLVLDDQTIGIMDLWRRGEPRFTDFGADLLALLSKFAVTMICGAAVQRDIELRHSQMRAIRDVQFLITAHRDLSEVLGAICQNTARAFSAVECTIRLRERDNRGEEQMRVAAWTGRPVYRRRVFPLSESRLDIHVLQGKVLAIEDAQSDPRVRDPEDFRRRGIGSLLAAPLNAGAEAIGVMRLYLPKREGFTDDEMALVESLAGQAAIAIENSRLFHDLQRAHVRLRENYEARRSTQVELVKKEKLAALGEMAALVAHEIRNPLTAVRGFAQRIVRRAENDEGTRNSAEIIVDEVDRLNKVIRDVLDFARRLEPILEEYPVNQLVQDLLTLEEEVLSERDITVEVDCAPNLPPLRMDRTQMRQVLLNLIGNARAAMPNGGTLTLRTRREKGGQVLEVADDGTGMPKAVQEKLFTPFFTTKTHGTGLGLTVAQRIVQSHGGRITWKSAEGKGTTFTIHMPEQTA
jgi:signal transduction histidine kinase